MVLLVFGIRNGFLPFNFAPKSITSKEKPADSGLPDKMAIKMRVCLCVCDGKFFHVTLNAFALDLVKVSNECMAWSVVVLGSTTVLPQYHF